MRLWVKYGNLLYKTIRKLTSSVAVLAVISLRSPRKMFIFIIKKYIGSRYLKNLINLILKKTSLLKTCREAPLAELLQMSHVWRLTSEWLALSL